MPFIMLSKGFSYIATSYSYESLPFKRADIFDYLNSFFFSENIWRFFNFYFITETLDF